MASSKKEQSFSPFTLVLAAVVIIMTVAPVFWFCLGVFRPLHSVGIQTTGRVRSVDNTGSETSVSYSFQVVDNGGRGKSRYNSETVWAYEARRLGKGSGVPVVYDPSWPSRNRLGTREHAWGGWGLSSLLKQAGYAALLALAGLAWVAFTRFGASQLSKVK